MPKQSWTAVCFMHKVEPCQRRVRRNHIRADRTCFQLHFSVAERAIRSQIAKTPGNNCLLGHFRYSLQHHLLFLSTASYKGKPKVSITQRHSHMTLALPSRTSESCSSQSFAASRTRLPQACLFVRNAVDVSGHPGASARHEGYRDAFA